MTTSANPMIYTEEVMAALRSLVAICRDGEKGYEQAAQLVKNSTFRTLFTEYSTQRAGFANELSNLAGARGIDNKDVPNGTPLSGLHRALIDLRAKVTDYSEGAILAECERGEDTAKAAYEKALAVALPDSVREIVQRQAAAVKHTHDYVRNLRDTYQRK